MDIQELFFHEPEREIHIREAARILRESPTTVSRKLHSLAKEGFLTREEKYGRILFTAARSETFHSRKLAHTITTLQQSGLLSQLTEQSSPEAVLLVGDGAKGTDVKELELVRISSGKDDVNLSQYEQWFKRKLLLRQYTTYELEEMRQQNKEVLNRFLNGITLHGYWEVFR